MTTTLTGPDEVKAAVGQELGVSDWYEVTQETIDQFAEVTGDHQWIHTDPEKAAQTPFGGTIAHGLFTLSLGPKFSYEVMDMQGFAFGVNYGYGKVRFPAPRAGRAEGAHARRADERRGRARRHPDHRDADLRGRGRREAGVRGGVAGAAVHVNGPLAGRAAEGGPKELA